MKFFFGFAQCTLHHSKELFKSICAALFSIVGPNQTARRGFEGKTCYHASTIENWQPLRAFGREMMMKCVANIQSRL